MAENTNKNTGGKAVNQNDILNIIDSSVKELESVIGTIIGLNQKIKMIRVSEIKDLRTTIKMLFGKRGVVTRLLKDIYDNDNYQFLKYNQYLSSCAKAINDVSIIIEKTKTTVSSLKKLGISLLIFIFNEGKLGRIFNILHTIINGVKDLPVVDAKELVEKMSNISKLIGLFHLAVLALILLSPSITVFIILSPLFVFFASSCYVMAHTLPLLYYVIEGLSMTAVACSRLKDELRHVFRLGSGKFLKKRIGCLFDILKLIIDKTAGIDGAINDDVAKSLGYIMGLMIWMFMLLQVTLKVKRKLFRVFLFGKGNFIKKQIGYLFDIVNLVVGEISKSSVRKTAMVKMLELAYIFIALDIIVRTLIPIKRKLFRLFLFGKGNFIKKQIGYLFDIVNLVVGEISKSSVRKTAMVKMLELAYIFIVLDIIVRTLIPIKRKLFRLFLFGKGNLMVKQVKGLFKILRTILRESSKIKNKYPVIQAAIKSMQGVIILLMNLGLVIGMIFSMIIPMLMLAIVAPLFLLGFKLLISLIKLIAKWSSFIGEKEVEKFIKLSIALGVVILICATLLLIAYAFSEISTNLINIITAFILIFIIAHMLTLISKIPEKPIIDSMSVISKEDLVLAAVIILCASLLLLVTKYLVVSTKWDDIFKIILLVVVVAAMLVGLGYMMKLGLPILQATLMILGIVFLSVSAIFLIVLELFILQQIRLDYDKIKTNVSAVIKTSFFIISCIFDSMVDSYSSEEDNIFTKIFKVLFKGGASIFTAFLGAIILIATVVSVLAILLIAGMLWLLGKITLDEGAIRNNVGLVLGLAKDIIDLIWDTNENKDGEESDKGWLGALIDYVLAPLGAILQAIMAVAYLALIIIAVLFILLIAGQLRLLQEIDLQEGVITGKVEMVFKIANSIISTVFNGGSKDSKESDKGWLGALIDYVLAPLGAILQAIMAVAYLALIIIAVLFILLIAGQLRLLQEIDLQEGVITGKVEMVFKIANSVIDNIWNRKDKKGTESKKGFLRSVFDVMGIGPLTDALMSIAFLAQTVATVGLIKTIAEQLNTLQKIDLQSDKIETNVDVVIETARKIIDLLWNSPERKGKTPSEENKGFFSCVSSFLFGDTDQDIADMASAAAFLTQTLSTIGAIHGVAKFLNDIQNIKLEQKSIDAAIDGVIKTSHRVIDKLWNEDAKNNKTGVIREFIGLSKKVEKRDEKADIEKMGNASSFMTYTFISILSIYKIAKLLNSLSNIKLTEANINDTVDRVISTAKIISNKITVAMSLGNSKAYNKESDEFKELIQKIEGFRTYTNKSIETIIGTMNGWATGLSKYGLRDLATIDISDAMIDNIRTKTTNIFSLSSHILGSIHDIMKKLPYSYDKEVTSFTKSLSDLTTSFCDNKITSAGIAKQERALNNYAKFITKIQSLDLKKLESAQQMFKHMAEFAKSINGNFDRLADSINEKIMPLLKELNDNLVQFKETQKEIEITKMEVENGIKPDNNGSNPLTDQDANRVGKATDSKLNNQKEQEEKAKYVANTLSEISEILLGYHNDASKGFKIRI